MYFYLIPSSCSSKTRYTFPIPRSCACRFLFFHSIQKGQKIFIWLCDVPWLYFWAFSENLYDVEQGLDKEYVLIRSNHLILSEFQEFLKLCCLHCLSIRKPRNDISAEELGVVRRWPWDSHVVEHPCVLFTAKQRNGQSHHPCQNKQDKMVWLRITFCLWLFVQRWMHEISLCVFSRGHQPYFTILSF